MRRLGACVLRAPVAAGRGRACVGGVAARFSLAAAAAPPPSWRFPPGGCACTRGFAQEAGEGPSEMERAVQEQQMVLFPRMRELEEARLAKDRELRRAEVPKEEWSPRQLPYKVFERSDTGSPSDDSDSDADEDSAPSASSPSSESAFSSAAAAAGAAEPVPKVAGNAGKAMAGVVESTLEEVDGVQVGIEDQALDDSGLDVRIPPGADEQGFVYKGMEPTLFGDWQHKGRTTDF
mmetsp:Transcript_152713/g.489855  ORF Transcript_152713/g.489855 Transcript_152713/m.489855 type:complete len:235 (-) Transcript_152713:141-845(-)